MREKFKRLESVQGLRTVIALELGNMDIVYSSSSVNQGLAGALIRELLELRKEYPHRVSQIIMNFTESRLLLYTLRDYVLVLHVDETFSVQEMRNAMSESQPEQAEALKADGGSTEILNTLENTTVTGDHLLVYQQIINSLKDYARDKMGAFVAANKLRASKERLHGAYKLLQAFVVGKDGSTAFRNVPETSVSMASRAIAAWALLFFKKCQEIIPEFPPQKILDLISTSEKQWKPLGFEEAWKEERLVSDLDT